MVSAQRRRGLKGLLQRRDGAAAVEFALISIPLFWIIFGMAEFGAMSMVQSSLDSAVSEAGRKIRTGAAQGAGMTRAQLEDEICTNLNKMMSLSCPDNLFLDVDRYDSFADVGNGSPIANGAMDTTQLGFAPGGANEVILVRAYYRWEVLTPLFGAIFANMDDGRRLVVSSMLFRNEPF